MKRSILLSLMIGFLFNSYVYSSNTDQDDQNKPIFKTLSSLYNDAMLIGSHVYQQGSSLLESMREDDESPEDPIANGLLALLFFMSLEEGAPEDRITGELISRLEDPIADGLMTLIFIGIMMS